MSLAVYKARRRRAALAAKTAARRRALIATVLCLLGIAVSVAVVERDAQIQAVEVRS